MEIFIPSFKDPNPYFDQITTHSRHHYVFDHYSCYNEKYKIVNVHWPEAIFGWKEPTKKELDLLEKNIHHWKKHSQLIYTRHDASRHLGMTPAFKRLFKMIEENANAFIHLGSVSFRQMRKKFPKASHHVIFHPLYESAFQPVDKKIARERLNIGADSLVIVAPGRIRNTKERDLILSGFRSIAIKEKVLLSNNMLPFRNNIEFPGRVKLKKIWDIKTSLSRLAQRRYKPPKYFFHYGFSNSEDLSLMMSAADVVFIPRINILNSGNIFLGLTFNKVIVGPAVGNLEEQLERLGFPLFNPQSKTSVKKALLKGIDLVKDESFTINKNVLEEYKPARVSFQMDTLFENLV